MCPPEHGRVGDVLRDGGLAHAVGADEHDVVRLLEELQRQELRDTAAVDVLGEAPVEVGERLEAPEVGGAKAPGEPALGARALLPAEPGAEDRESGVLDLIEVLGEPVQAQRAGSAVQRLARRGLARRGRGVRHRRCSVEE